MSASPHSGSAHPLSSLSAAAAAVAAPRREAAAPHLAPAVSTSSAASASAGLASAQTAARALLSDASHTRKASLSGSDSAAGPSRPAPSKKRKVAGDDSPGSQGAQEGFRTKKSKAVSCSECKRRKIKCDRKIPCLACCKRGEPEACRWAEETLPPLVDSQPFALTSDLLRLARRLEALEQWTQTLPPELRAAAPVPQGEFKPEVWGTKVKAGPKEKVIGANGAERPSRSVSVAEDDEDQLDGGQPAEGREASDPEDAAVKLEAMAFSVRAPNLEHRPQDNHPFFETQPNAQHTQARSFRPAELTAWRTSIVAVPLVYEGPWSASTLGIDFCENTEQLAAAGAKAIAAILARGPDKALAYKLVAAYFDEIDWCHVVFHRKSFEAELDRMWEMVEEGRSGEIDPMWLACYFMVLCLALGGLRCQKPKMVLSTDERLRCDSHTWFAMTHRLLQLGDGTGRPQVRFIQAVILVGQWLQFSTIGGQASRFMILMASAIRSAQLLGLHRLGSDPRVMPTPDPAWPPNACSLRREMALRLFGLLSFLDSISSTSRLRSYLLDPAQCNTPPVSNVNLDELSLTTCELKPKPRSVYTDSSWDYTKYRLCRTSLEVVQKLGSNSSVSYDDVLGFDRMFQDVLAESSPALDAPDPVKEANRMWSQAIAHEALHTRLVKLHRPFMHKHEYSRQRCLESAEQLIRSDLVIVGATKNVFFVYSHCLTASICLFVDLYQAIDRDLSADEIEKKKQVFLLAFEVFGHADEVTSVALRHVVETGAKVLNGLFSAVEKHRVARAANALVGGAPASAASTESYAAVLQRISQELDLSNPDPQPSPLPHSKPLPPTHPPAAAAAPSTTVDGFLAPMSESLSAFFGQTSPQVGNTSLGPPVPYDVNLLGLSTDASMSADFFRDVGLTSSYTSLAPFDFSLDASSTASASAAQPAHVNGASSGIDSFFGGLPSGTSDAMGASAPTWTPGGEGGSRMSGLDGEGSIAATTLMDQLAGGGVW